jgi:CBS domain-containing protein
MIAKQIISLTIPNLSPNDSIEKALNLMETFKVSHLPVVLNKDFFGLVSESILIDVKNTEQLIGDTIFPLTDIYITDNQHIYDAINIISDNKLSILPVLNFENKFLGSINLPDLLIALKQMTSIENIGSIIILEVGNNDYSLTEIANIVESENIKVLSSYVNFDIKNQNIQITLKLNTNEILAVLKSFERFNYTIKSVFANNKINSDIYKDRLDELLFYLNM